MLLIKQVHYPWQSIHPRLKKTFTQNILLLEYNNNLATYKLNHFILLPIIES